MLAFAALDVDMYILEKLFERLALKLAKEGASSLLCNCSGVW